MEKISEAIGIHISQLFEEKGEEILTTKSGEPGEIYGRKRYIYDEIVKLLDRLPDSVIDHYRMLLKVEVEIRSKPL